ncbi:MAG: DNA methyltransferase [Brevinema sp.]
MQRQETIKNRTIFCGDCLDILRGFNDKSIDLIYLDPPFNKKKQFVAPIGSDAEGAEFKDYWVKSDIKDAQVALLKEKDERLYNFLELSQYIGDVSNKYYLTYMAIRLIELKRVLKDTGSIYLHCDNTMGHYLKLLLDVIFGHQHFRNEIVWCYTGPSSGKTKQFPKKHDSIFWFSKGEEWLFDGNNIRIAYKSLNSDKGKNAKIWGSEGVLQDPEVRELYLKRGKLPFDWWDDIPSGGHISPKERLGYPTQKPLALLERIIKASCPEGGIVLDPFCGCATTCVASEKLGKEWIGIDISKKAYELVNIRLHKEIANPEALFQHKNVLTFREDIPDRTDIDTKKLVGKYKKEVKIKLYGLQAGNCAGCSDHFRIENLAIDHIIPQAKGGSDNEDNLQLLCTACNSIKGDRTMDYLVGKILEIRKRFS